MMKIRAGIGVVLLMLGTATYAQQQGVVEHAAPSCFVGAAMPFLSCSTSSPGLLRAYFRKVGNTDWCSVDGHNRGRRSDVTLPRFESGDQLDYYLVVLNDKQVVAKSAQIYRVQFTSRCDSLITRHATLPTMECLPPGANPLASALAAGYAAPQSTRDEKPPVGSPEKPERQR